MFVNPQPTLLQSTVLTDGPVAPAKDCESGAGLLPLTSGPCGLGICILDVPAGQHQVMNLSASSFLSKPCFRGVCPRGQKALLPRGLPTWTEGCYKPPFSPRSPCMVRASDEEAPGSFTSFSLGFFCFLFVCFSVWFQLMSFLSNKTSFLSFEQEVRL